MYQWMFSFQRVWMFLQHLGTLESAISYQNEWLLVVVLPIMSHILNCPMSLARCSVFIAELLDYPLVDLNNLGQDCLLGRPCPPKVYFVHVEWKARYLLSFSLIQFLLNHKLRHKNLSFMLSSCTGSEILFQSRFKWCTRFFQTFWWKFIFLFINRIFND